MKRLLFSILLISQSCFALTIVPTDSMNIGDKFIYYLNHDEPFGLHTFITIDAIVTKSILEKTIINADTILFKVRYQYDAINKVSQTSYIYPSDNFSVVKVDDIYFLKVCEKCLINSLAEEANYSPATLINTPLHFQFEAFSYLLGDTTNMKYVLHNNKTEGEIPVHQLAIVTEIKAKREPSTTTIDFYPNPFKEALNIQNKSDQAFIVQEYDVIGSSFKEIKLNPFETYSYISSTSSCGSRFFVIRNANTNQIIGRKIVLHL